MNLANKIFKRYGNDIYNILEQNPYRLADDIEGVGFRTADEIASRAGIKIDSEFRIKSGIFCWQDSSGFHNAEETSLLF